MQRILFYLTLSITMHAAVLSVEDAVAMALKNHPDAYVASMRYESAKADSRSVQAALRPRIDLNGEYFPTKTFVMPANGVFSTRQNDAFHTDISASYTLWDFGRTRDRYHASLGSEEESGANKETIQNALIEQVWFQYYSLGYIASVIDTAEISVRFYQAQLNQATGMRQAGLKTIADESRFKASLMEAEERLRAAHAAWDKTQNALGLLIGSEEKFTIDNNDLKKRAIEIPSIAQSENLRADMSASNPQLAALRAKIERSKALFDAQNKEAYGTVSIVGSYGYDNSLSSYDSSQLGIRGTIPLYDGGKLSADAEKSKIALDIARKEYESAEKALWQELYSSYRDFNRADETIAAKDGVIDANQKALALSEGRYAQGLATYVDILESQNALDNARNEYAEANFLKIQAWAHIQRLLNKGCENDVCKH